MITFVALICMTIMITTVIDERKNISKELFLKLLVLSILVSISLLILGIFC